MFILSLATLVAALAVIAFGVVFAETTLVYIALGMGGLGAVLLVAEAVTSRAYLGWGDRGDTEAGGAGRQWAWTGGLGKASVPATATSGASTRPEGQRSGATKGDGRFLPAPADRPERAAVSGGLAGQTPRGGPEPSLHPGALGGGSAPGDQDVFDPLRASDEPPWQRSAEPGLTQQPAERVERSEQPEQPEQPERNEKIGLYDPALPLAEPAGAGGSDDSEAAARPVDAEAAADSGQPSHPSAESAEIGDADPPDRTVETAGAAQLSQASPSGEASGTAYSSESVQTPEARPHDPGPEPAVEPEAESNADESDRDLSFSAFVSRLGTGQVDEDDAQAPADADIGAAVPNNGSHTHQPSADETLSGDEQTTGAGAELPEQAPPPPESAADGNAAPEPATETGTAPAPGDMHAATATESAAEPSDQADAAPGSADAVEGGDHADQTDKQQGPVGAEQATGTEDARLGSADAADPHSGATLDEDEQTVEPERRPDDDRPTGQKADATGTSASGPRSSAANPDAEDTGVMRPITDDGDAS